MKLLTTAIAIVLLAAGINGLSFAGEDKSEKISDKEYSYINDAPVVTPEGSAFLFVETKEKPSTEKKLATPRQCFATRNSSAHCMH